MFLRETNPFSKSFAYSFFRFSLQKLFCRFSDSLPLRASVAFNVFIASASSDTFAVSSLSPALPPPMLSALRHTVPCFRQEMDTQASHGSVRLFFCRLTWFALLLCCFAIVCAGTKSQLPLSRLCLRKLLLSVFSASGTYAESRFSSRLTPLSFCLLTSDSVTAWSESFADPDEPLEPGRAWTARRSRFSARIPAPFKKGFAHVFIMLCQTFSAENVCSQFFFVCSTTCSFGFLLFF